MAEFVNTSSGYINLDYVMLIRLGVAKEEGESIVQFHDGRTITCQIFGAVPGVPAVIGFGDPAMRTAKPPLDVKG